VLQGSRDRSCQPFLLGWLQRNGVCGRGQAGVPCDDARPTGGRIAHAWRGVGAALRASEASLVSTAQVCRLDVTFATWRRRPMQVGAPFLASRTVASRPVAGAGNKVATATVHGCARRSRWRRREHGRGPPPGSRRGNASWASADAGAPVRRPPGTCCRAVEQFESGREPRAAPHRRDAGCGTVLTPPASTAFGFADGSGSELELHLIARSLAQSSSSLRA